MKVEKRIATLKTVDNGTHPMCFEENRLKVSNSNKKEITEIKTIEDYYAVVSQVTSRNLITYKKFIENYDLREEKFGYELDHMYSISEGYKNNIDPEIIGHWTLEKFTSNNII